MFRQVLLTLMAGVYFTTQALLVHAQETHLWAERREAVREVQVAALPLNTPDQLPSSPSNFPKALPFSSRDTLVRIPLQFASVKQIALPPRAITTAPFVVILQDVHDNEEAQRHLAGVIDTLGAKENILVGVEAAFGEFDFQPFRKLRGAAARARVAERFLKAGRIAAPSYLGLTAAKPPAMAGIEDLAHYQNNVRVLLAANELRPALEQKLAAQRHERAAQKSAVFNNRLKTFDALISKYDNGEIKLGEYVTGLWGWTTEPRELILEQFHTAYQIERSLDFKKADQERAGLIEKLIARCSQAEAASLARHGLALQAGRLSYADYHRYLTRLFEFKNLSLTAAPAFTRYVEYVALVDAIDGEQFTQALMRARSQVGARLARTLHERRLWRESERAALTEKLINFALTPAEWEIVQRQKNENSDLEPFLNFYREADRRSEKMAAAMRSELTARRMKTGVILAGGFHAALLAQLLKKAGVANAIAMPRLTKVETADGAAYLSVFAREKRAVEELFKGERLYLGYFGTAAGTQAPMVQRLNEDLVDALMAESDEPGADKRMVAAQNRRPRPPLMMWVPGLAGVALIAGGIWILSKLIIALMRKQRASAALASSKNSPPPAPQIDQSAIFQTPEELLFNEPGNLFENLKNPVFSMKRWSILHPKLNDPLEEREIDTPTLITFLKSGEVEVTHRISGQIRFAFVERVPEKIFLPDLSDQYPHPAGIRATTLAARNHFEVNQDTYLMHENEHGVQMGFVGDGMGGYPRGDDAARIIRDVMFQRLRKVKGKEDEATMANTMALAAREAERIIKISFPNALTGAAGAWVVVFPSGDYYTIHFGDVRVYVKDGKKLRFRTLDRIDQRDSLYSIILRDEDFDDPIQERPELKLQRRLASAVKVNGNGSTTETGSLSLDDEKDFRNLSITETAINAHFPYWPVIGHFKAKPGAWILIVSDGVHDPLSHEALEQIVNEAASPAEAVRNIAIAARREFDTGTTLRVEKKRDDDIAALAMEVGAISGEARTITDDFAVALQEKNEEGMVPVFSGPIPVLLEEYEQGRENALPIETLAQELGRSIQFFQTPGIQPHFFLRRRHPQQEVHWQSAANRNKILANFQRQGKAHVFDFPQFSGQPQTGLELTRAELVKEASEQMITAVHIAPNPPHLTRTAMYWDLIAARNVRYLKSGLGIWLKTAHVHLNYAILYGYADSSGRIRKVDIQPNPEWEALGTPFLLKIKATDHPRYRPVVFSLGRDVSPVIEMALSRTEELAYRESSAPIQPDSTASFIFEPDFEPFLYSRPWIYVAATLLFGPVLETLIFHTPAGELLRGSSLTVIVISAAAIGAIFSWAHPLYKTWRTGRPLERPRWDDFSLGAALTVVAALLRSQDASAITTAITVSVLHGLKNIPPVIRQYRAMRRLNARQRAVLASLPELLNYRMGVTTVADAQRDAARQNSALIWLRWIHPQLNITTEIDRAREAIGAQDQVVLFVTREQVSRDQLADFNQRAAATRVRVAYDDETNLTVEGIESLTGRPATRLKVLIDGALRKKLRRETKLALKALKQNPDLFVDIYLTVGAALADVLLFELEGDQLDHIEQVELTASQA